MRMQLEKTKSKTKTWTKTSTKHLWVALGIIVISLLPYLHNLFPNLPEGGVLGYSSWNAFLWSTGMYLSIHIAWLIAYKLSIGKPYRFALLIPVFLSLYQLVIIFTNQKSSAILNGINIKLGLVVILSIFLIINFFKNNNNEGI